jgi:hypothetical protein
MKRYIPELQSLAARVLADKCRKMNLEERYFFLKEIPKVYREYILGFPSNFICWFEINNLLNVKLLKKIKEEIPKEYQKDCEKGFANKKIILRKCSNFYCHNFKPGRMIIDSRHTIMNLCFDCYIPFGRWINLRTEIRNK